MHNLKNSRILVTGGAGFIGSYVTDILVREGVKEVVIVDNFLRGSMRNLEKVMPSGKVTVLEHDIRDAAALDRAFEGIDYCFHLAALRITRCAEFPQEANEVMINGTQHVINSCVKHGIKKLVAASSASIYGMADKFPTAESHHPYNNRTLYGAMKTANEQMYRSYNDMQGLKYAAMRYFNVYGPRMDTHGKYTEVLIRWYNMIREGQSPQIYGAGSQTMDFVHVADVARATILAMKADVSDEVFNVASGQEISLCQLCEALLAVMESTCVPNFVPMPEQRKTVEVVRRLADVKKAKKMIGFESQITLEDGLKDLVQWLEQNLPQGAKRPQECTERL
jgi:UDP-glucose 4-epimerase